MATAQNVIDRVRQLINDVASSFVSGLRWTDAEMLQWLTDGQRELVVLEPEANVITEVFSVTASPRQSLDPATAYRLIRVEANGEIAVAIAQDVDSIATGDEVVGNDIDVDLTLDGAAVSGGVATFAVPVQLLFTINVLDAGGGGQVGTFHVTGTLNGSPATEDVSFTNDNTTGQTAESVGTFDTVTGINFTMAVGPDAELLVGNLVADADGGIGEYGNVITIVEKDVFDSFSAAWSRPSAKVPSDDLDYYKAYAMDPSDPLAFWLSPCGTPDADVIVTYAGVPATVAAVGNTLTLSDMYVPHLVDYLAFRTLSKDARAGAKALGQTYRESFLMRTGAGRQILRAAGQNTRRPPEAEA